MHHIKSKWQGEMCLARLQAGKHPAGYQMFRTWFGHLVNLEKGYKYKNIWKYKTP